MRRFALLWCYLASGHLDGKGVMDEVQRGVWIHTKVEPTESPDTLQTNLVQTLESWSCRSRRDGEYY